MTRLEKIYREKVVPVLQKEFNYSSSMQLPGIEVSAPPARTTS